MPRTARRTSRSSTIKHHAAHWLIPHHSNNHHPKAIRHTSLAVYAAILLLFNISYNVFVVKSDQVLGFATAISQPALIQLTNQMRAENGVGQLTESPLLDKSAMAKAQNMFAENYWAHYAPSGKSPWYWFDQAGYTYTLAGENLARDFDTSTGVINGWMNSPSHKANMLAAGYTQIGIAVLNGTLEGQPTTLVVQHFGTPLAATTSNQPPTAGSSTPTITPSAPLQQPAQEQALSQELQTPQVAGAAGIPIISADTIASLPYKILNPQPIAGWGIPQTITVIFLALLMTLFLIDTGVLHRKNMPRQHSHSLLHAGALAAMILVVIYSTLGGVL